MAGGNARRALTGRRAGLYTLYDMGFLRIIYWGIAYTTGIACATAFFLRYLLKRDIFALKLFFFLLAFGLSVVCLSVMEGYSSVPRLSNVAGQLALIGASLIMTTFPAYALGFDDVKLRRRIAMALRILGFLLAGLNGLCIFVELYVGNILYFVTLALLGVSIYLGMSWISRGSIRWESKRKPAWMASLFVLFGVVIILDFFRGAFPALRSYGGRYFFLPGFYAYLNVFLLYNHVTDWTKDLGEAGKSGPSAQADRIERYGVSKREAEVLVLLARGRTYLEMADSLCVSLATIKSHVSHLYEKTGTRNKVELINLLYDSSVPSGNQPKSR